MSKRKDSRGWVALTIIGAAIGLFTMQLGFARIQPPQVPVATIDRDVDYRTVGGQTLKLDPYRLTIHGEQDATVPTEQAQSVAVALRAAGVETTLKVVLGRGHAVWGGEFQPVIRTFFDSHLKQGQPG